MRSVAEVQSNRRWLSVGVAFQSSASNLVPAQNSTATTGVYARDLLKGTIRLVSVSSIGIRAKPGSFSAAASISADGRYVALVSEASNLVAGDTNGWFDIFIRDMKTSPTRRVRVGQRQAAELRQRGAVDKRRWTLCHLRLWYVEPGRPLTEWCAHAAVCARVGVSRGCAGLTNELLLTNRPQDVGPGE